MTDNLSERAEQLAETLLRHAEANIDFGWFQCGKDVAVTEILTFAEAIHADSVNLARGLALEQAAQAARTAWIDVASKGACEYAALRIGQLTSTDAAQALAAHDVAQRKLVNQEWCDAFKKVTKSEMYMETDVPSAFVSIIMTWIGDAMAKKSKREQPVHDAEIERRARLGEHKHCWYCSNNSEGKCERARELAALAQPAPAKEDK